MTTLTKTTSNSQMRNDIMTAGSKERLPMLAIGRYTQWQSHFLRYVDTKPNKKELRQCIFMNTTPEKLAYFDAEAEAIHMILSGIGDDIYSIVDACTTTKEMWIAIERLQQGESLNKQDVKTNLQVIKNRGGELDVLALVGVSEDIEAYEKYFCS
ncbi:hypothetical protein Tco_1083164 [Tanacetum coccineum]|uniref:Uncharacterized protein n=1 Tax=Tanacetum coccineum TaxID=301880 RepID=A0ABQ5I3R9_9ASTR